MDSYAHSHAHAHAHNTPTHTTDDSMSQGTTASTASTDSTAPSSRLSYGSTRHHRQRSSVSVPFNKRVSAHAGSTAPPAAVTEEPHSRPVLSPVSTNVPLPSAGDDVGSPTRSELDFGRADTRDEHEQAPKHSHAHPDAPPTPQKDRSPLIAPAVPQKDPPTPTPANVPPLASGPRAWSPSLSGSLSRSSSISLSRQASISNAKASPLTPRDVLGSSRTDGRTTPECTASPMSPSPSPSLPRSARSVNRKRMSLGYINNGNVPGSPSPSTSATRPVFHRQASTSALTTPRSEAPNPFSPPRQDGQTVMDMSKTLLADIAHRQRRIGELKAELKTEEDALKSLQSVWQDSVARDLAYENGPASATSTASPASSPSLAKLRAPRQRPPRAGETTAISGSTPDAQSTSLDSHQPGVADALRGFSAKLPAGWGGQLNSLLDGLNSQGGATSLDVLSEEGEAGAGSDGAPRVDTERTDTRASQDSSAPRTSTDSTTRANRTSKRNSSLFGSFSALKEQFEESLVAGAGAGGTVSVDGSVEMDDNKKSTAAPGPSTGWSTWSKRLKDAAARAEKALGEAMALPEETAEDIQKQQQHHPSLSPSATSRADGHSSSSRRSSVSPSASASTRQFDFTHENQREKSALAELELGWLSNLMAGNAGRDGERPKQISPEELLSSAQLSSSTSAYPPRRPSLPKSASSSSSTSAQQPNFFGMLSSAWGGDKLSDQFDSVPTARSPSPRAQTVKRTSSSAGNGSTALQQRLREASRASKVE